MECGIKVDGPSAASVEAVANSLVRILEVCAESHAPESVQLESIKSFRETLRVNATITGCSIYGDRKEE